MERQTGLISPQTQAFDEGGGGVLSTYVVYFLQVLNTVHCLVLGCLAILHRAGRLQEHVMYRHYHSRIVVVQEGREPLHLCIKCIMHFLAGRMIKYQSTARCNKNEKMRWQKGGVAIAIRFTVLSFRLTGEDGAECIGGWRY